MIKSIQPSSILKKLASSISAEPKTIQFREFLLKFGLIVKKWF